MLADFFDIKKNVKIFDTLIDKWDKEFAKSYKEHKGRFFGAAIVDIRKKGKVVVTGVNSVIKDQDPTSHAEIVTMRKGLRKLKTMKFEPYHVLVSTHEPCVMCTGAAYWFGINRIFYIFSFEDTAKLFGIRQDLDLINKLTCGSNHFRTSELLRLIYVENKFVKKQLLTLYEKYSNLNKEFEEDIV